MQIKKGKAQQLFPFFCYGLAVYNLIDLTQFSYQRLPSLLFKLEKAKTAKGTNWEQKIQKPQNENICLTNLNEENNGNFPILTFVECKPIKHSSLQILSKIIGISTAFALKSVKNVEKHHSSVIFIVSICPKLTKFFG